MRVGMFASLLVGMVAGFGSAALAGPAYTADDIVQHFAPPPDLGASRSLCIGTEGECAKATAAPKATTNQAFDLVVNFEYNSDDLTPAAKRNLDEFAKALKDPRLGKAAFSVNGHTDGKGSERYNLSLSERRANAVVSYLESKGVDQSRLAAHGFGKLKPKVADPLDPANRRVETRLRTE